MAKTKAFELINPKHTAITVNVLTPGLQPVRGITLSRFGKETITPDEAESPEIKKLVRVGRLKLKAITVDKPPKPKPVADTEVKSARETKPEISTPEVPEGERVKSQQPGKGKDRTKPTAAAKKR